MSNKSKALISKDFLSTILFISAGIQFFLFINFASSFLLQEYLKGVRDNVFFPWFSTIFVFGMSFSIAMLAYKGFRLLKTNKLLTNKEVIKYLFVIVLSFAPLILFILWRYFLQMLPNFA